MSPEEENKIIDEAYQALIGDMADRYARTDYDQLDSIDYKINVCIENGELEKADSLIRYSIEVQRQIAADTTQFNTLKFKLVPTFTLLWSDYTETTEQIFSSSIETINTIGNVLFTENVARLYQLRGLYKSSVCDSLASTLNQDNPIYSVKRTLDIPYSFYALLSHELLTDMQQRYAICKQLMDVTDEEIEVYRKEREALEGSLADDKVTLDAVAKEISQLQTEIDTLKAKLKLEDN